MDTNAYVTFLLIGVLLVAVDGQLIYRSGRRYLESAGGDPNSGASMIRLVTILFHLVVLGVLALLSVIDFGGDSTIVTVVTKLGVTLLVLAVAHGVTLGVLGRIRDEQVGRTGLPDNRPVEAGGVPRDVTVTPVPGQPQGRGPTVSPSLERTPYPDTDG